MSLGYRREALEVHSICFFQALECGKNFLTRAHV
jgi:hypothetical protein